jgi:hypothetical protein
MENLRLSQGRPTHPTSYTRAQRPETFTMLQIFFTVIPLATLQLEAAKACKRRGLS